jgi:hypothetical protein
VRFITRSAHQHENKPKARPTKITGHRPFASSGIE